MSNPPIISKCSVTTPSAQSSVTRIYPNHSLKSSSFHDYSSLNFQLLFDLFFVLSSTLFDFNFAFFFGHVVVLQRSSMTTLNDSTTVDGWGFGKIANLTTKVIVCSFSPLRSWIWCITLSSLYLWKQPFYFGQGMITSDLV